MKLFDIEPDATKNLLPQDGTVNYFGKLIDENAANDYLNTLLATIEWRNDEAVIFGKKIVTKRKVAWYGDKPFEYTYSKTTKSALPWTTALLELKEKTEQRTGETFNSCLLNLYHDGNEGMGWHSDAEKDLKKHGAIASISLGAARKFAFKHKETKERIDVFLESGSLLIMKDNTQDHWVHRLPPTKRVAEQRVNLTFRTVENH
ncbi:alpha-ketoglutarate-dependent dioxygenase AlkB family protein [Leeuwenhoekiella sp. NPDC079379]|uniref:alpha-ketoglutarate-dependent dioxygenase AlkB family protein n=1 Tax=Leeuwenhoekiella sp. NPDC079379 TaxID=3364122 RepID=UPI0037C80ACD